MNTNSQFTAASKREFLIGDVRRSMRFVLAMLTILALTGCSDVVTTRFSNLADAKSQGAFERGWLPPLLPDSARAIVERNNVDLNTGTGSFDYDLLEKSAYIKKLTEAGVLSRTEGEIDILSVTTGGSRWEIRLPHSSGSGEWSIHTAMKSPNQPDQPSSLRSAPVLERSAQK